jgi:outer membrane receptor protein involved in Fe transport
VASGYRPGTVDVSNAGAVSDVDSDSLWSYEVGVKGDLAEGLVSYDVAVYYFDWDNFQTTLPEIGVFLMTNSDGGITGKGLEASVTIRPLDGLSIITNMAYNSSELNDDDPSLSGLSGQQTPRVPEWSASSRIRYDFSLASGQEAYVGLGLRYEDSSRSDYTNGFGSRNNVPSDSYVAADLNLGMSFDAVTLGLYATNLFNERAIQSIVSNAFRHKGVPIKPRTVGVRLSVDF